MKIIKNEELETQLRPDGRNIKQLLTKSFNNLSMSFILVEHPANFEEKQHLHKECFEIFFFFDKAKYRINGKVYDIEEGDLVVLEPGDVHGAVEVDNKVKLFVMQIPPTKDDKIYVGEEE